MRDLETARIAIQSALTGHLVLSTLHTNNAPATVMRLVDMGVDRMYVGSSLLCVVAQRLVKRICKDCNAPYTPTEAELVALKMEAKDIEGCNIRKGKGCDRCRKTGYAGRLGIYELMVMDDAMRDIVTRNPDVNQLRKLCREKGLVTLRQDGFDKVMKGMTTVDEILRVTENAM